VVEVEEKGICNFPGDGQGVRIILHGSSGYLSPLMTIKTGGSRMLAVGRRAVGRGAFDGPNAAVFGGFQACRTSWGIPFFRAARAGAIMPVWFYHLPGKTKYANRFGIVVEELLLHPEAVVKQPFTSRPGGHLIRWE
jgi:hypothetical protein